VQVRDRPRLELLQLFQESLTAGKLHLFFFVHQNVQKTTLYAPLKEVSFGCRRICCHCLGRNILVSLCQFRSDHHLRILHLTDDLTRDLSSLRRIVSLKRLAASFSKRSEYSFADFWLEAVNRCAQIVPALTPTETRKECHWHTSTKITYLMISPMHK
jgi:hypothetical protein